MKCFNTFAEKNGKKFFNEFKLFNKNIFKYYAFKHTWKNTINNFSKTIIRIEHKNTAITRAKEKEADQEKPWGMTWRVAQERWVSTGNSYQIIWGSICLSKYYSILSSKMF